MIFDCFTFFNEFELLKIREDELSEFDVIHVLVESEYTFTGKPKPLYYKESGLLSGDTIQFTASLMPNNGNAWENEAFQRNYILEALKELAPNDDDFIIIADADEIPRAKAVEFYNTEMSLTALTMDQFSYYLNCLQGIQNWTLPRIMPYKYLKNTTPDAVRRSGYPNQISNAGWHFGYLGGIEKIKEKFNSFSHKELNIERYCSKENLKRKLEIGESLWSEDQYWYFVKIGLSYPKYIINNQERFKDLIKII